MFSSRKSKNPDYYEGYLHPKREPCGDFTAEIDWHVEDQQCLRAHTLDFFITTRLAGRHAIGWGRYLETIDGLLLPIELGVQPYMQRRSRERREYLRYMCGQTVARAVQLCVADESRGTRQLIVDQRERSEISSQVRTRLRQDNRRF